VDAKLRYVAIEGLIGVGKTALAERLSQKLGARVIREEVEENPYLAKFYKDIKSFAFQTQLFFLFSRYKQQTELRQANLFEQCVVSDYLFDKDRIFAYVNLNEFEISLYEKVYAALVKEVIRPDLVVYLQARLETIHERLRRRGRSYETDMSDDYLQALGDAYNRYFLHYDATPLLIVNTDNLDFVNSAQDFESLFREIVAPTQGRRFFSTTHTKDTLWSKRKSK
jgi:deoxyadenosine/deoxycytidine kinase